MTKNNETLRESELVYLLLREISQNDHSKVIHISVLGLHGNTANRESNCYITSHNTPIKLNTVSEWKIEVIKMLRNTDGMTSEEILINNLDLFEKEEENKWVYGSYDIVFTSNKSGDQRHFLIEAKGDSSSASQRETYIKGQIQCGIGQLILAGSNEEDRLAKDIKWGTNYCLAFPFKPNWCNTLKRYLKNNRFYDAFTQIFGLREGGLAEFRFFMINRNKIKILNKRLDESRIGIFRS